MTLSFSPGLGLAVVARIVEQLGGQLRVDSQVNTGSRFSFLIPFALVSDSSEVAQFSSCSIGSQPRSRTTSEHSSYTSEIDGPGEALTTNHVSPRSSAQYDTSLPPLDNVPSSWNSPVGTVTSSRGILEVQSPALPIRPVKVDYLDQEVTALPLYLNRTSITEATREPIAASNPSIREPTAAPGRPHPRESRGSTVEKLRILVVEVSQQSIYL